MFKKGRLRKPLFSGPVYGSESEVPDDKKGVCLCCGGSGKRHMLSQALGEWVPFTCGKCGGTGKINMEARSNERKEEAK